MEERNIITTVMYYRMEFEEFYPRGKIFYIDLDKYICHKLKCGKCLINKSYIDALVYTDKYMQKNDIDYCPNIIKSIYEKGYIPTLNPVSIHTYKCGHYDLDNGRHRICAAAKLNIPIYVKINKYDDSLCKVCLIKKEKGLFRKIFYKNLKLTKL